MKKPLSFKTRMFGTVILNRLEYQDNGRLAVEVVDQNDEPIAMLSVNIPESTHLLSADEFFVKTWNENEEIAEDALASGIFRDTGRTSQGALCAPIWTLK